MTIDNHKSVLRTSTGNLRLLSSIALVVLLSGCQSLTPQKNKVPEVAGSDSGKADKTEKIKTEKIVIKEVIPKVVKPKKPQDVWARIQNGLSMDLDQNNRRIDIELNWYKKNASYFKRVSKRAEPYIYFIVKEAEARQVPLELALMPVVESAFDPFAYSHAGASGLWQFMPATGRHYGLKQNWWYDGRRDVVSSTRAALDYMKSLHKMFGDWELALAAFNSGPGRVQNAVNKNKRAGKSTRFWNLDLPRETTAYVPKLIALGKIIRNPEKFGIELTPVANKPYFAKVNTGGQIDMAKASSLSGVPLDQLYKLNPGLNRWSTPPSGPHYLIIPIAQAEPFRTKLTGLPPEKRLQWQRYTVQSGDSLNLIAKKYRTRVKMIVDVNKLDSNVIRIGQSLLIPISAKNADAYTLTARQRTISKQNRSVSGRYKIEYKVKSGDSFWTIARKYKVGVKELARWNGMSPKDPLKIGQKLAIWKKSTSNKKGSIVRKVNYKVRNGDSLARIASKFNVNVSQIRDWNSDLNTKYIHPGQMVTLYVDVTRAYQ